MVQLSTGKYPSFVNTVADFMFSQESPEDLDNLLAQLQLCTCDLTDSLIHSLHKPPPKFDVTGSKYGLPDTTDNPYYDSNPELYKIRRISSTLYRILIFMLSKIDISKLAKLHDRAKTSTAGRELILSSHKSDSKPNKPGSKNKDRDSTYSRLSYYYGSDPCSVIQSSLCWYQKYGCIAAVEFLTLSEAPSHDIRKTLFFSHPTPMFQLIDVVLERIKTVLEAMFEKKKITVFGQGSRDELFPLSRFIEAAFVFITPPNDLPLDDTVRTYRTLCEILEAWICKVDETEEEEGLGPDLDTIMRFIAGSARDIFKYLKRRGALKGEDEAHIGVLIFDMESSSRLRTNSAGMLFSGMSNLRAERRCMNLSCKRMPPDTLRSFPLCVGCTVFSYCSKTCQKHAWSNPPHPLSHRSFCKDLGRLTKIWGSSGPTPTTMEETFARFDTITDPKVRDGDLDARLEYLAAQGGFSSERIGEILDGMVDYDHLLMDGEEGEGN